MRKKDPLVRKKAIKMWLNGGNFSTIRDKTGESVGKLSKDLNELRKEFPELDELRRITILINKNNSSIEQVLKGAHLVSELEKIKIDIETASDAISQISSYGKDASKILLQSREFYALAEQKGMSYSEILEDFKEKIEEVADLTENKKKLEGESEALRNLIKELDKLKKLQDKTSQHNITFEILDAIIENQLILEKLGFIPNTAEVLAKELNKNGLDPENASKMISSLLSKYGSLVEAVDSLQRAKETLETIIATDNETSSKLQQTNQGFIELNDKLKRTFDEQKVKLQNEHEILVENLHSKLEDEKKKARKTIDELTGNIETLKKQMEETQVEIQFAQAIVDILNSRDISENQLSTLTERLTRALEQKRKGYIFFSKAEVEGAKQQLIRDLSDLVKMDIVSKKEHEQVKEQINRLTAEYTKIKSEAEKIPKLNKEIQLRDEVVGVLSKGLSPGKHFQRGWLMGCTSCKVQTIFYLHPEHIQSLFKKGYLTFECVCGQKTNFTLEDLYYDILKYGFYTLKG